MVYRQSLTPLEYTTTQGVRVIAGYGMEMARSD